MAVKNNLQSVSDTYFELIRRFPLITIKNDAHLDEALAVIDSLTAEELDGGGEAYLEVLTRLVEDYEDEHAPIPDASEADVLRLLMESRGLSQGQLGKAVGISQSTLSAVLNGIRKLTKEQVIKLAKFFHTPA